MTTSVRKNIYFNPATVNYIEQYRKEHRLPTFTSSFTAIIEEHHRMNSDVQTNTAKLDKILTLMETRHEKT